MSAAENKKLIAQAYEALAAGDRRPLGALYAEDVRWDMMGTTAWSGLYEGRATIAEKLLAPLFAQFGDVYVNRALRIIAEDDLVAVESRGRVTTKAGKPYNNAYCWIYRMREGKIVEITEYLDTALVNDALEPPPR
ncbi:MAG: nuclear transport factor 2 family protein [Pseudomonadota bacterium]|nr:nuclear transport factor 2 family protein [Pseudomonadota bacterium]